MTTVSLHGIRINSITGLYAEEKILENSFEVDIDVQYNQGDGLIVDYTMINSIVWESFKKGFEILELIAEDLYAILLKTFPFAMRIKITIRKYHPPMPGQVHYAQISLEK